MKEGTSEVSSSDGARLGGEALIIKFHLRTLECEQNLAALNKQMQSCIRSLAFPLVQCAPRRLSK